MNSPLKSALDSVRRAESEVHNLLHDAVQDRLYDELPEVARIVKALAELAETSASSTTVRQPRQLVSQAPNASKETVSAQEEITYPVFLREDDYLVKLARSRANDATYEHKAPLEVLDEIARRAQAVTKKNSRPFGAESLTNVKQHGQSTAIPGYQVYLCLGWLKHVGLLKQHGRKGYSIASSKTFDADIKQHWEALPSRTEVEEVTK